MPEALSQPEFAELIDLVASSKIGKRIVAELQAKHQLNADGEYDEPYWNELAERQAQAAESFAAHSRDIHLPFSDEAKN